MAIPSAAADGPADPQGRQETSLLELIADWYWEQDAEFRFTNVSTRRGEKGEADPFPFVGRRVWDQPALNLTDADWERHRAVLAWHQSFRDFEVQHVAENGRIVWVSLSGQATFDEVGVFKGYRGVGRDITAQKRAEHMHELEHAVARVLTEASHTSDGVRGALRIICEFEGWDSGRCFRIDPATGEAKFSEGWFAREADVEQLLRGSRVLWESGKPVWSTDLPRTGPGALRAIGKSAGRFATFALPVVAQNGTIALLAFSGQTTREPDPSFVEAAPAIGRLLAQFLQRKGAEESLRESEARFRSLTQLSSDFFWESDPQHRLSSIVHGPSYGAPVGYGLLGKTPWELPSARPDDAGWQAHRGTLESRLPFRDFEVARALPDGSTRYFSVSGQPRYDSQGNFLGYRGVGRDVTEIALARERIASLAYSDPLTGLANRISLSPALEQAIERARRQGAKLAGVFLDLDGFKQINDELGHEMGDRSLQRFADALRESFRPNDAFVRFGGDEFLVVAPGLDRELAEPRVEALRRRLASAEADRPALRFSVGIAELGAGGRPEEALRVADSLMYAAKANRAAPVH